MNPTHSALLHTPYCTVRQCVMLTCMVQKGQTVLHISSSKGDVGMMKFILEQFNPDLEAVEEVC